MVVIKSAVQWGTPSPALGSSIGSTFHDARALGAGLGVLGFALIGSAWQWPPGWQLALVSLAVGIHSLQRRRQPNDSFLISLAIDTLWLAAFLTLAQPPAWVVVPGLCYLSVAAALGMDGWRSAGTIIAIKSAVAAAIFLSLQSEPSSLTGSRPLMLGGIAVLIHLPAVSWLISTSAEKLRTRDRLAANLAQSEQELRRVDDERQEIIRRMEFQASLLDQVRTMVVAADLQGALVYANANAVGSLGIRPEQMRRKRLLDLVIPEEQAELLRTAISGTWRGETVLVGADGGSFPALVTLTQIQDRGGTPIGLGAIAIDISERKRTEERLASLLASKDEFVTSVSHELRTPLTVIVGMAEELRGSFEDFSAETVKDLIEVIAGQARDLADIVSDLLVIGRSDAGGAIVINSETVDLEQELSACLKLYWPPGRKVHTEPGSGVSVLADPLRLRQVVRNLLTNAVRYGGDELKLCIQPNKMFTSLSLCDNGPGIPDQEAERIFQPYVRSATGPALPGSMGLGLAVARRLSQLMGGDLVYRRDGEWSVFELTLPTAVVDSETTALVG